jgi:hypothetical protein
MTQQQKSYNGLELGRLAMWEQGHLAESFPFIKSGSLQPQPRSDEESTMLTYL